MPTYRAGIVGLTGIAARPASAEPALFRGVHPHSHAACYAALPNVEVVGICDLEPRLFDQFDGWWGQRWKHVNRYTDYRAMLEMEKLDLLSVVTSDHRHAQIVVDAANARVRGIYCEKPIATTLVDADRMIAAVEQNGAYMAVNNTRRWYASYYTAVRFVDAGHLGPVRRIQAAEGGPRAMLFRNATHQMDVVNMFAQSEPEWVVGFLDPGHESYGPRYAGDGGKTPTLDPGGTGLVRFQNGVIASFFNSKTVEPTLYQFDVFCQKGQIRITEPGIVEVITAPEPPVGGFTVRQLPVPQYTIDDGVAAVQELIDLIEGRKQGRGISSGREARKTLAILVATLQSQARGNVPITAPFADAPESGVSS